MEKTLYKIQVGAFRQKANAEKMLAKVKKAGIPASIVPDGDAMKVQCGAFSVQANAEKRLALVKKKGFLNAIMITIPAILFMWKNKGMNGNARAATRVPERI